MTKKTMLDNYKYHRGRGEFQQAERWKTIIELNGWSV